MARTKTSQKGRPASGGNLWAGLTPEERSAKAKELNLRSQYARAERKRQEEEANALELQNLSVEELKQKVIGPKAAMAINRLWTIATERNDKQLLQWFAEQRVGRPMNRAEVDHQGGITINIVRPPRGEVVEGEVLAIEEEAAA